MKHKKILIFKNYTISDAKIFVVNYQMHLRWKINFLSLINLFLKSFKNLKIKIIYDENFTS